MEVMSSGDLQLSNVVAVISAIIIIIIISSMNTCRGPQREMINLVSTWHMVSA